MNNMVAGETSSNSATATKVTANIPPIISFENKLSLLLSMYALTPLPPFVL